MRSLRGKLLDAGTRFPVENPTEVYSPDGIPEKVTVSGDIGMISSQAILAVSIEKKSAFYLSGHHAAGEPDKSIKFDSPKEIHSCDLLIVM